MDEGDLCLTKKSRDYELRPEAHAGRLTCDNTHRITSIEPKPVRYELENDIHRRVRLRPTLCRGSRWSEGECVIYKR